MSNSSLVSYTRISPNRTSPRNHAIDRVSVHCFVGQVTAKSGCNAETFTKYDPDHGASCNYVVGHDGSIGLCVEEKDRSWCTSSRSNDHRAITIEMASDTKDPYSPAAACALLGKTPETTFSCTLCRQTVYKYIDRGDLWPLTNKKLRYKGKRKRTYNHVRAAKAPRGESIERRPENVDSRMEPGHWEMDSVVSGRGGKAALLVLTERATRYEIAVRVPDHTSASVVSALDRLERRFGSREFRRLFKTITVDNGSEFSDRWGMERSWRTHWKQRTRIFYCHPYSSWERGSNEKQNQMIRWHFPKGTNFTKISQSRIDDAVEWLNNYPRKILGWRSAGEVFREFLASVI